MSRIVVAGNPVDGFTFYALPEGWEAGDISAVLIGDTDWWVAELRELIEVIDDGVPVQGWHGASGDEERPEWASIVHKATPHGPAENPRCAVCGQRVKSVPGGQGPTWVHSDSGAVAGPNPSEWKPILRSVTPLGEEVRRFTNGGGAEMVVYRDADGTEYAIEADDPRRDS